MNAFFMSRRTRHLRQFVAMFILVGLSGILSEFNGKLLAEPIQISGQEQRKWKDASGSFTIEATLVEVTATNVRLRDAKGRVIDVPLEKLSRVDRDFLKQLNPGQSEEKVETDGATIDRSALKWNTESLGVGSSSRLNLAGPRKLELKSSEWTPTIDALTNDVGHVTQPVRLAESLFEKPGFNRYSLVAIDQHDRRGIVFVSQGKNEGAHLQVLDLQKAMAIRFKVPIAEVKQIDISPSGELGLFIYKQNDAERLVVFAISEKALARIGEWDIGDAKAVFADEKKILLKSSKHGYSLFDFAAGKVAFSIPSSSSVLVPPCLSSNGKLLAIPGDKNITIVDLQTAQSVGNLQSESRTKSLAFSPDGLLLAGLSQENDILLWNMRTGNLLKQFSLVDTPLGRIMNAIEPEQAMMMTQGNSDFFWVGNKNLLVHSVDLIDIELETAVWRFSEAGPLQSRSNNVWYMAKPFRADAILFPLLIPDPELQRQRNALEAGKRTVLEPGMAVSLDLRFPFSKAENEKMQERFESILVRTGFMIDPNSDLVLRADFKKGEMQKISYDLGPVDINRLSNPGKEFQPILVSFTPTICYIGFEKNGEVLWSFVRAFTAPKFVGPRPGESIESIVQKACKPESSYLTMLKLPTRLSILPDGKMALGYSRLTAEGIKTSLEPPQPK